MAGSYNKVLLMGNLTRDPELRHTQSNMAVTTLGLAVNNRWKDKNGEMREDTVFVDCDAWGRTAELLCQYLTKGRPVFIEGRLKLDEWTDKQDGSKRSKLKVVVENFQFVDSRGEGATGAGGPSSGQRRPQGSSAPRQGADHARNPAADAGYEPVTDDDIPF